MISKLLGSLSWLWLGLILPIAICSCRSNQKEEHNKQVIDREGVKDPLIKANRYLIEAEDVMIDDFIRRYNWNMQKSPSGLRYFIYRQGSGNSVLLGHQVTMHFESRLLDGTICYSSELDGPKTFILGKAQVEKGLEEGLQLLHVGDRAKFILPSHLAFGLIGDQRKIPARSALVYDIEVVSSFALTN